MLTIPYFILCWVITDKCNLSCKHCYKDSKPKKELALSEKFKIYQSYCAFLKRQKISEKKNIVVLSGGNPLLSPDLFVLLEEIRKKTPKSKIAIMSNGTLIGNSEVKYFKKYQVDLLHFSLEGDKENNDYIRGNGVFEKVVNLASQMRKKNITSCITITANSKNMDNLLGVTKKLINKGIIVNLRRIIPLGKAKKNNNFLLSRKDIIKLYNLIAEYNFRHPFVKFLTCDESIAAPIYFLNKKGKTLKYPLGNCLVKQGTRLAINPEGKVILCPRLPLPVGDLTQSSFSVIYSNYKKEYYKKVNQYYSFCKKCVFLQFCKGGSACYAYAEYKKFSPDPHCILLADN